MTVACGRVVSEVLERNGLPGGISTVVVGSGRDVGERLIQDERLKLVSFTGSTEVCVCMRCVCVCLYLMFILLTCLMS